MQNRIRSTACAMLLFATAADATVRDKPITIADRATFNPAVPYVKAASLAGGAPMRQSLGSPHRIMRVITTQPTDSLFSVRDTVRRLNSSMTGDIVVQLSPGSYHLARSLVLDGRDSGTNGYDVIWKGGPEVILDGGIPITNWSLVDYPHHIYHADVSAGFDTRQIYVNGVRAQRARGEIDPKGWSVTQTGFLATERALAAIRGGEHVELVGRAVWKEFRCQISDVAGASVNLVQPCWKNAHIQPGVEFNHVSWVENSYQLLKQKGQWYLDQRTHYLYYMPRAGEDLRSALVTAAGVQTLVDVHGSPEAPVHNIVLDNISYRYTGWTHVNSRDGYAPLQAGFTFAGAQNRYEDSHLQRMTGAVSLAFAHHVVIKHSEFTHLGGMGISILTGSAYDELVDCSFSDISGSSAVIGETTLAYRDAVAADSRNTVHDIIFAHNRVTDVASEYHDNVGVFGGYVQRLTVTANEISNLPYTGISVGWGWRPGPFPLGHNKISGNYVHEVMQVLADGGSVYVLGGQPESSIDGNCLVGSPGSGVFLDNGSEGQTVSDNVIINTKNWLQVNQGARHNVIVQNTIDVASEIVHETDNVLRDNFILPQDTKISAATKRVRYCLSALTRSHGADKTK